MNFHDKLKTLREHNELTQGQVAKALNVSRSTYSYYEIGKTKPDINMLVKLARLYKKSVDELLCYEPEDRGEKTALRDDYIQYGRRGEPAARLLSELNTMEQDLMLNFRLLDLKKRLRVCAFVEEELRS